MSEDRSEARQLAAYCGLYCDACSIRNGDIRDTARKLKQVLEAYGYAEWAPQLAEYVPATKHYPEFEAVLEWLTTLDCPGCQAGGGDPGCAIRLCAREKGLAGCWQCAETSCEKLKEIGGGYNLQHIREAGLEAWLADQAEQVKAGFSYLESMVGDE